MAKSYLAKMREFRGGTSQAAVPASSGKPSLRVVKKNSLPRVKRARNLGKSGARSLKRKTHSLSERSGTMARKVKRKRDKKGHFIKKATRTKKKRPAASRKRTTKKRATRRTAKRRAAPRARKVKRIKRKLGRHPSGKFVARRRHKVKSHVRKGKRVKAHLSYETAAPNPRRRRRARRAAREVEEVMPRKRRRAKRKTAAPRKRRRAAREAVANPVKRRRRRARRANPTKKRRRARRVSTRALCRRPARRRPRYVTVGGSRRSKKRRKTSSRRKKRAPSRAILRGELPRGHNEHGEEGYALENPLSGGELLLAGVTATLGFAITDIMDRWLAVKELNQGTAKAPGVPLSTAQAVMAKPGIYRILAQAGAAALPFTAAYWVKEPMGRAALQGAGLGALVHLGSQLMTHFVIEKFVSGAGAVALGATPTMKQKLASYYAGEMAADNAADLFNTGTAGTLSGVRGLGRPGFRSHMTPRALGAPATGKVGDCGCGGGASAPGSTGDCLDPADPSDPSGGWNGAGAPGASGGGNGVVVPPSGTTDPSGGGYTSPPSPLRGVGAAPASGLPSLAQMFPDN